MPISFQFSGQIDPELSTAIQVLAIRSIRVVGPIPFVLRISVAFGGILFSVSVGSSEGHEIIAITYTSPSLPAAGDLQRCKEQERYHLPEHPFLVKLERDLFAHFMSFKLAQIAAEPDVRRNELLDLAEWLSSDRDLLPELEGLLAPRRFLQNLRQGGFSDDGTTLYMVKGDWPSEDFARVKIFFATNRSARPDSKDLENVYTAARGDLQFGHCEVTIPWHAHTLGEVERPRWWLFQLREDPTRHVTLRTIECLSKEDMEGAISEELGGQSSMLLFVHGYNVSFADAARRTAQIKFDLAFEGPTIMFSWASLGSLFGYPADEATAEWSVPHFEALLQGLLDIPGAQSIHLIAHSMGNRIVTRALESLALLQRELRGKIRQVFLAAPDIDAATLLQLSDTLQLTAQRVTLYGSDSDLAIKASRLFHGAPRAGQGGVDLLVHRALDSIDATELTADMLGHSYVTDCSAVLSDIHELVRNDCGPAERFGLRKGLNGGWMFVPR
jgi:esterase/lipase superfamily enzyme